MGNVRVIHGDMLVELPLLSESFHACICDPPYHLQSIHKRFAAKGRDETSERYAAGAFGRHATGFMGKQWDGGDIAFRADTWNEVLRVLKPGAHLLAFGGTRTFHRMACAIEDAGFEIRDTLCWLYGSGFPKSHNAGNGWGTALKPAYEPIILARKPLGERTVAANMLAHGTGALNVDACRIHADDAQGGEYTVKRLKPGAMLNATGGNWRPDDGPDYHGSLSPGRWPANVVHDGSEEVLAGFPESKSPMPYIRQSGSASKQVYGDYASRDGGVNSSFGDSGSAARFFYTAKADKEDRLQSKHPTVKPVDLIRWLARMVTPPGGTILDCFAGSGTTGMAALMEGFNAVLVEREAEYVADIRRRLAHIGGDDTPLFAPVPEDPDLARQADLWREPDA